MFKTLRSRIFLSAGVALFCMQLLLIAVLLWFGDVQHDLLASIEHEKRTNLIHTIELAFDKQFNIARIGAESVAKNPEVLEALAAGDRDRLLDLCLPLYESISDVGGVSQLVFVDENLHSLLLLHNPEQFGDDMSSHPALNKSRDTGQSLVGLEKGQSGFGFRAVIPLFDQDRFIGAVEYRSDFGEKFIKDLQRITAAEIFLYELKAGKSTLLAGTLAEDEFPVQPAAIEQAVNSLDPYNVDTDQGGVIIYPLADIYGDAQGFIKAVSTGGTAAISSQALSRAVLLSMIPWLLCLLFIFLVLTRSLRPLKTVVDRLDQMKLRGFSSIPAVASSGDEIGRVINSLQELADMLNRDMNAMQERSLESANSMAQLSAEVETAKEAVSSVVTTTDNFSEKFNHVVESTRQASAALNEIAKGSEDIAISASSAAKSSNQTNQKAIDTSDKANRVSIDISQMIQASQAAVESVAAMQSLSNEIGTILEVIMAVAEETNLLALNAAIEAARAGDQGRGFAVVAEEIRKLAENTKESTHSIGTLIDHISTSTNQVVAAIHNIDQATTSSARLVNEILTDIHDMTYKVGEINTQIENIAAASQEQTAASQEISASMSEIEHFGLLALDALQGLQVTIRQLKEFIQHTEETLIHTREVSQRWSYYELRENLDQRRSEHESWVAKVRRFEPAEFDPTRCRFGQFYYNYRPNNPELLEVYSRFEEPHRRLHEAGHRSIDLYEAGRLEEAAEAIKAMEVEYQKIRVVFEEFYRVMEQLFLEGTSIF